MIRNNVKNIIIVCIVISMLFSANAGIVKVTAQSAPIIVLNDSAAWVGDINRMDTVGTQTEITGETGIVYTGLNLSNELVEFTMRNEISGGWVGLKFRSNLPYNAPWDNSTGYFFLMQETSYQIMRQKGLEVITHGNYPDGINISDGVDRKIVAGVFDSNDGNSVNIVFKIDDVTVLEFSDTDTEKMSKGSSVFSIYQYGNTKTTVTVQANEESTLGGVVERNAPNTSNKIEAKEDWFVNNIVGMGQDGGTYAYIDNDNESIILNGRGGATSNEYINASTYSFKVSLDEVENDTDVDYINQSGVVLFRKQDRSSPYGKNSYGIRFSLNGRISLVSYVNDNARVFPAYETGLDFSIPQEITVEIYGDIDSDEWVSEIFIYAGSKTQAYRYRDSGYNPNFEPPAFFGVLNIDANVSTVVSDVFHNGKVETYYGYEDLYPVYFAELISEEENNFLRWNWRTDNHIYTKAIITTKNGHVLGEVNYPNDKFFHPDLTKYDKLFVSAVDADGKRSDAIEVDLTEDINLLKTSNVEKIIIKSTDSNAGFFTEDTNKPFIVNGVNYIPIRFGDHATFEPEFGLVPSNYDPYATEALMRTLRRNGYNFIRVFIIPGGRSPGNVGLGGISNETEGLYIPYMECFVDFLSRANEYGIYVMPTFGENEMVSNKFFRDMANNAAQDSILFTSAGIDAKKQYLQWFLEYVKNRNPEAINSIFALQMQNEFAFHINRAPFNQRSGTYTFIDGTKYDMTNDDERRNLANAAIINYYREMKEAVNEVVPGMLLSEGTFSMLGVGKNFENVYGLREVQGASDVRVPMSGLELLRTDIDFLDLHVYRYGQKGTAEEIFERNYANMLLDTPEAIELLKEKPIILGEYGSFSSDIEEFTIEEGMAFTKGLRDSAMSRGFAGAAYWTIDTFEQTNIWNLMWENGKYLPYISLLHPDGELSDNWNGEYYLQDVEINAKNTTFLSSIEKTAIGNQIKNLNTRIISVLTPNSNISENVQKRTLILPLISLIILLAIATLLVIRRIKRKERIS